MQRVLILFIIASSAWLAHAARLAAEDFPLVVNTDPLSPDEQLKKFHLPPGFEIQLVAAEPEVQKPINLAFDQRGRLLFSQSVEYPFAAKPGAAPRDSVRLIERIDAAGRAAKVATAVDGLNIPIGLLPLKKGELLVYSIPNIYKCFDADGDGVYEKREVLFGPFDQRDTHGMNNNFVRGIDGWIYACHGFANDSKVAGRDGHRVHMNSGNTYRFRDDGSRIEHYTHGQVNPFGLCFDALGNLYSADCHTMPAYCLLRGAYYPSFGKPHDGLGFGPQMVNHLHGSTGIAGIVYYAADHFPPEYRDTVFIGNPITHRVNHDKLQWHGSSPVGVEQPDFLRCDDPWFRPVDLKLGPDGALYIADFYNRIIGHYEVPLDHPGRDRERGRIWRVVYRGTGETASSPALPNFTTMDAGQLLEKLEDSNLIVRTMATHELVDRFGNEAAAMLRTALHESDEPAVKRAHALRALAQIARLSDEEIERLTSDRDNVVRIHLIRTLAERADWNGSGFDIRQWLIDRLQDQDATVRRTAADALGQHPDPRQVSPLLDAWRATPAEDTHLIHTVRMALRNQLLPQGAYDRLSQAERSGDARQRLAEVSLGVPRTDSAAFLLETLAAEPKKATSAQEWVYHVVRYLAAERLNEVYALAAKLRDEPTLAQRRVLSAIHRGLQARGITLPTELVEWAVQIGRKLLTSTHERQVAQGLELARELRLPELREQAEQIAREARFTGLRPAAIDACVACDAAGSIKLLAQLIAAGKEPMALRQKAAQALGSINEAAAHRELAAQLAAAPYQLASELAAGLASNPSAAELLISAIESGKAPAMVLRDAKVDDRLKKLSDAKLRERVAKLVESLPAEDPRLRDLVYARTAGFAKTAADIERGKQVFLKNCAACHKLGGEGNKVGPELDGIGHRGVERLIEDVLDPNRNVDQAFRSTIVTTDDGRSITGLLLREEGQVLVLADNQGKEVRVPGELVLERTTVSLSPMPGNVADLVSEEDFDHLIGFLVSQEKQAK